jgi:F-box domain
MNSIPDDICAMCLMRLSTRDLFRSRLVCRRFLKLLSIKNIRINYKLYAGKDFDWLDYLCKKYPEWRWHLVKKFVSPGLIEKNTLEWDKGIECVKFDMADFFMKTQELELNKLCNETNRLLDRVSLDEIKKLKDKTLTRSVLTTVEKPFMMSIYSKKVLWSVVCKQPDILWNYERLSENTNVTWGNVQEKMEHNWRWEVVLVRFAADIARSMDLEEFIAERGGALTGNN